MRWLRKVTVRTRLTILSALPLAGLLLCVLGLNYITWRGFEDDRRLSMLHKVYVEITDATTQIEAESIVRQLRLNPDPTLDNQIRTQTALGLAAMQRAAMEFPPPLQALSDNYERAASALLEALRDDDSESWESAQTKFRQQSYLLIREIAESMVRAGERRELSSELRSFATLKITNDLVARVATLEKWQANALANTEIASSMLAALEENLGILSDQPMLDEGRLSKLRSEARKAGLTLSQDDIDLKAPTQAALFAVTEYYRPQLHDAYEAQNTHLRDTMQAWTQRKRLISGLSLLASILFVLVGAAITRAVYHSIAKPLGDLAGAARKMEQGILSLALDAKPNDEIGEVARGFVSLNSTVQKLDEEFVRLEHAAIQGDTHVRGDSEGLQGDWLHLIDGMNRTLDLLDTANARLMQAQKMEVYAKMSGGIAHQFNNLLTVILGNVELQSGEDPVHAGVLEPVMQAGQRAKALVSQLQALGSENGLQLKAIKLTNALQELESCAQQILPDKIHITIEKPDSAIHVLSDSGTLQQSFTNLMLNARDALVEGGNLRILLGKITLSKDGPRPVEWASPGIYHAIEFRDDGPGIPAEILTRVFEPFFSTKDHGESSGLGLSMVYGFTRQCGGWTSVESSVDQGASVTMFLPKANKPAQPEVAAPEANEPVKKPAAKSGKGTVLLVEDDLLVCKLTHLMLTKIGYEVIEAHDGKEGLDALERHYQDLTLVVSDVLMPHLTGPQMIQTFLKSRELRCGVLFVTGYSADELPGQIGELGENFARLNKPFTFDGLQTKVSELVALAS